MPSTRSTALLLGLLLTSCATSHHVTPTNEGELTRLVLLVNALPDNTATHAWRQAEDFDLSPYNSPLNAQDADRHVVLTMGDKRDCDEENRACIRECMSRPLPPGYGHTTSGGRGRGGKAVYCNEKCMRPYLDCTKLQELQPQEFTTVDKAVEWLKHHRASVLVGSIVIVAGVAFVVVSAGVGVVILVPAVLLAAPSTGAEPFIAEVSP